MDLFHVTFEMYAVGALTRNTGIERVCVVLFVLTSVRASTPTFQ